MFYCKTFQQESDVVQKIAVQIYKKLFERGLDGTGSQYAAEKVFV